MESPSNEMVQPFLPLENQEPAEEGMRSIPNDSDAQGEIEVQVIDDRPDEDQREPADLEALDQNEEESADFEQELSEDQVQEMGLGKRTAKRINKLVWRVNEERRQREEKERMQEEAIRFAQSQLSKVQQLEEENTKLRDVLQRGEEVMYSEVRSRGKSDLAMAEQAYRRALEEGDTDAIVESQKALVQAQWQLQQAEQYQPVMPSGANAQPAPHPGGMNPPSPRPAGPQVPQAAQGQVPQPPDPRLQQWFVNNQDWFHQDDAMTAKAYEINNELLLSRGLNPQSEEYYNQIDSLMEQNFPVYFRERRKLRGNPQQESVKAEEPAPPIPAPSVVASSASRESARSRKPRNVQLTRDQVELANRLGVTPESYARELLKQQEREQANG